MAVPIVENALKVVTEGIKYLTLLRETSPIRKMKKAIEAAENYIRVNEKSGEFKDITDVQQLRYLRHYAKRYWHFN